MPTTSAQETKSCITIKGSAEIVCEYLSKPCIQFNVFSTVYILYVRLYKM